MITSGIGLIISAFPGTQEAVTAVIAKFIEIKIDVETNYLSIICGFSLIGLGFYYNNIIKDRIYVLNMLGIFSQVEISDMRNIRQLKLADFKIKEILVDFTDVLQLGEMSNTRNKIIVEKIKKQCEKFKNRSTDFKSCFTGMAPIPYTILAGYYLSGGSIKRFFEYNGAESKYLELREEAGKNGFPLIKIKYPNIINKSSTELTVAISITAIIQDCDISQFKTDILRIDLNEAKNNIITSVEQLENYCDFIITEIEKTKEIYPVLNRINIIASIPSCVSEKLGEQLSLRANRMPKIVAYHYVNSSVPKYPFGIVVSDSSKDKVGILVEG